MDASTNTFQMTPQTDNLEAMVRNAWEAGFSLAVNYGDNHIHCQGDQRERQWKVYWNAARSLATPSGAVVEARPFPTDLHKIARDWTKKWCQTYSSHDRQAVAIALWELLEKQASASSPSVEPTVDEQVEGIMEVVMPWNVYCKITEDDPDGYDDLRERLKALLSK